MANPIERIFNHRLLALIKKEFAQIRRDQRLMITITIQPAVQLLLLGFALSATVTNLKLGVVDEDHSIESRALVNTLGESKSFRLTATYGSMNDLARALGKGDLSAGIVVPYDYSRNLMRGAGNTVQFLLNGVNANTAAISQGYAQSVIDSYNAELGKRGSGTELRPVVQRGFVSLQPAFLYNPGLEGSWFLVTGVFGLLLLLNASLVAETTMIRERERGTIEQLLMLPASTAEIVIAKIAPLFAMLCIMLVICMLLIKFAFRAPFHGSFALVTFGAALCLLCGIGVGTTIASFSKSAKQSMLLGFFVNPLLFSLSGSLNPVEGMPKWMQPLTALNPIHHLATIARGCLIKGSGFSDLWTNFFGLAALTLGLLTLSIWRFRGQLS
ncbi:MAG: ABC transporter permease [Silvibacterium sp.]